MPDTLYLKHRNDFGISGESDISLLDFTDGWQLLYDGWHQAIDPGSGDTVVETLSLICRGTSHNNLAANIQALDAMIARVGMYAADEVEPYGVWLVLKMANETNERQALIRSARRSPVALWTREVNNSFGGFYYLARYNLALERQAFWEATSLTSDTEATLSSVGGLSDYGTVVGDIPARLAKITFVGTLGGGGPLTKVWMGFRTDRFGARANFQTYWSLRKGSLGTDTTSTADATAKDGNRTTTTFATPTMVQRVLISVVQVTTNEPDQRGRFLVLLRAKLSAAGTARARLSDGLFNSPTLNRRARVVITGTSWLFYEMGTVQIPSPARAFDDAQPLDQFSMAIDAERVTGVPQLHMDCLVLIPIAEGWVSASMAEVGSEGILLAQSLLVYTLPNGSTDSIYLGGSTPKMIGEPRGGGGLPVGAGVMVVAGQRATSSVLADTFNVTLDFTPRWNTLRGAE